MDHLRGGVTSSNLFRLKWRGLVLVNFKRYFVFKSGGTICMSDPPLQILQSRPLCRPWFTSMCMTTRLNMTEIERTLQTHSSMLARTLYAIRAYYTVCPRKNAPPPKYNGVVFKILANISEIFTTEFSTYLYIACKNSWMFNVKIVFYYVFSITRPKHKFP